MAVPQSRRRNRKRLGERPISGVRFALSMTTPFARRCRTISSISSESSA